MYFFFFILLLAGCARVPPQDKAQLYEPPSLELSVTEALARDFFEEGGWPSEKWWEMFQDPQLSALIDTALQQSPTLQYAYAKVVEVEQEAKKQRAALFPTLNADYTENVDYFSKNGFIRSFYPNPAGVAIPASVNQIDLSLNFSYELDFFGKNQHLFKAALGAARAQRAEAHQATLLLTTLIAHTYIELQMKLIQLDILEEKLHCKRALLDLAAKRAEVGVDSVVPTLNQERGVYYIEQAIIQLDKESQIDQHMLNVLVGKGPDEQMLCAPLSALFDSPVALPPYLSTDLLARRPDLKAQLWRVEAAAQQIGAAQADFYPRVNLSAFAGLEALQFPKLLTIGSRQGGVEPAIHLPIFTGGKLKANLKGKVAQFNEASYLYNQLLLQAVKEVADDIVILTASFDMRAAQALALDTVDMHLRLQQFGYEEGLYALPSVLELQEKLLDEQFLLYGYERDTLLAVVKMIKALGGGYHP